MGTNDSLAGFPADRHFLHAGRGGPTGPSVYMERATLSRMPMKPQLFRTHLEQGDFVMHALHDTLLLECRGSSRGAGVGCRRGEIPEEQDPREHGDGYPTTMMPNIREPSTPDIACACRGKSR